MPEAEYRNAPGVNISALKKMRLSPAHYKFAREEAEPDKHNANLIIGTLVHRAKLEPHRLSYAVRPAEFDSWRTKASQQWRDSQTLPVVTPEEEQDVLRCADALGNIELLNELCARGKTEVSAFKRHRTGLMLKGRADIVAQDDNGNTWIVDIKTVPEEGASPEAFAKKIADLDYHLQAAHYCDLFGTDKFIFIAVEKKGFPGVGVYQLSEEALEIGRRTNDALLSQLARCNESGVWTGYPSEVMQIDLPIWKKRIDGKDLM
jgi:exodeoxyribonuclease VIII